MYGGDREQTVFNMINAMLLRIHQSGHLANIDEQSGALVKEGIAIYKKIRRDIKTALPFWSLGTSSFSDEWVSLGLRCEKCAYIAVWRRESAEDVAELPIKFLAGKNAEVSCIYPSFNEAFRVAQGERQAGGTAQKPMHGKAFQDHIRRLNRAFALAAPLITARVSGSSMKTSPRVVYRLFELSRAVSAHTPPFSRLRSAAASSPHGVIIAEIPQLPARTV